MASILWYYLLAIIGVGITAHTIYKKRDIIELSTFLVFYLFATCTTWIGEFIVLGLLNGYAYKPGIYTDLWAENILGHLILNSTLYPGTAILVAAYFLRIWVDHLNDRSLFASRAIFFENRDLRTSLVEILHDSFCNILLPGHF